MKITSNPNTKRHGFTLVELLVVIAISAVLAALGFKGYTMAQDAAKKTTAAACINQLVIASTDFFNEYSQLPLGSTADSDSERQTDNQLMAPLLGLKSAVEENPKEESFFKFQNAKGKGNEAYNGLDRDQSRAELYGPWKNKEKSDRYYMCVYDYDYDEELREPNAIGNELHFGTRVLVYHRGKDGKTSGKFNRDNVYSWPKSN